MSEEGAETTEAPEYARFRDSSAKGDQTFTIEQLKQQERADAARHRREEQRKESEARRGRERQLFMTITAVVVASWAVGTGMVLFAENPERQDIGREILVIVLSGLLGGVAGYISGSRG
ncbi:MAG: hypothetical protein M3354_12275 [Chloroflexota bacterium]|nr:hypothetical protein [Chloroflexota bacterium]